MGYESRLYIIDRWEFTAGNGVRFVTAGEIARFDMRKMAPSFRDLFTEAVDFDVYGDDGEPIEADRYGDALVYAPARRVAEWLKAEAEREGYRRLRPLLAFLKALEMEIESWDGELIVVHYGY